MKFSIQFCAVFIFIFLFGFLFCAGALAAEPPVPASPAAVSSSPVLPAEFAGWQVKGDVTRSDDPAPMMR
jgi:hypothetical protein